MVRHQVSQSDAFQFRLRDVGWSPLSGLTLVGAEAIDAEIRDSAEAEPKGLATARD